MTSTGWPKLRLSRVVAAPAIACLALLASTGPSSAMCGGNIFMTCPPSKKAEPEHGKHAKAQLRNKRPTRGR